MSGGVARAKREKRARDRKGKMRERVEGTWGWMVRGGRRSTGWNKGDETVGVCNCSGFNALLMADGTQDWGNGLHQMSLLVREEGKRKWEEERNERRWKSTRRDIESAGDTWSSTVFSATDFVCSFLPQLTFLYLGILRESPGD